MNHVAFLRNVNLGQRGHPAASDILAAFCAVEAREWASYRSNGTIVFDADDAAHVIAAAEERLRANVGYDGLVFGRPLEFVGRIADDHGLDGEVRRRALALFSETLTLDEQTPEVARRGCSTAAGGAGWAVVENHTDKRSNAHG